MFVTAVPSSTIRATSGGGSSAGQRALEAAFAPVGSLPDAEAFVRRLAHGHYENFSVVSRLVPRTLRQDFCNVYAFCRTADDLGDELGDRDAALRHLDHFRRQLESCYAGRPAGAVFTALRGTIDRHSIPSGPFLDLISAFEQDQRTDRYDTFDQLQDYCRRSANPVGRLVLYVCGYRDEIRHRLSDHTCTALQLTNFWQDVRRDLDNLNRIYLPRESMDRFRVTEDQLRRGQADAKYRDLLRFEVDRAEELFTRGDALLPTLSRPVAAQISLFGQGGRAILAAIRAQDYDTLSRRPTLSKRRKAQLVARALGARAMTALFGTGRVA